MQLSFLIQGATGAETPLTTREVGGGQVYVIELGDEAGSTLEFGVVGDYLVIGKGDAVDRFVEVPANSLAENTQFQAVMDTLPVEYNGLTYIDLAQAIPLMEVAAEESGEHRVRPRRTRSRTPARAAPITRLRKKRRRRTTPRSRGRSISTRTSTARSVRTTSPAPTRHRKRMRGRAKTRLVTTRPMPSRTSTTRQSRPLPSSRTPMVNCSVRRPSSTSPSRLSLPRQALDEHDGQGARDPGRPAGAFSELEELICP